MFRLAVLRRQNLSFHHSTRTLRRNANDAATQRSRIERLESRLPRFLQRVVTPVRNAPVSHITSFLILHEITAVVPLVGLTAAFHYFNWLPPYISELKWFKEGTEKFGKYLRKKGWIKQEKKTGRWFGRGESGVRIVVELATAYTIVKLLLPLRLLISVWLTPWFARWTVLPLMGRVQGLLLRTSSAKGGAIAVASPAAGTNAVGGGALPIGVKAAVK